MDHRLAEPTPRTFASEGLTLTYFDWGNAAAPTLILLHGSLDHARSWDWAARALGDRWHVVALDLRGHGDSDWSPDGAYLPVYHQLDLEALVDALGVDTVSIVAHSFGGGVAARYAAVRPERVAKLVLVDGFGPGPEIYAQWQADGPVKRTRDWIEKRRSPKLAHPRRMATVEEAAERMQAANTRLSPEQAHHLALHGTRRHADGHGWKYDPRVGMFSPDDFAIHPVEFWGGIAAPTLILYPSESWTTDPEGDGRAAKIADRRTIVFEGAGHWLHHDRLDAFVAALDDFL